MKKKRIDSYIINEITNDGSHIEIDIDFGLIYPHKFNVLDRLLTAKTINIQYNSKMDKPSIRIKTLKGPTLEGFNLKPKHLKEIKELLKHSDYKELNELAEML